MITCSASYRNDFEVAPFASPVFISKASSNPMSAQAKRPGKAAFFILAIVFGALLYFVYPGPQMRAEAEQKAQAVAAAAERAAREEQAKRDREIADAEAKQKEDLNHATPSQFRDLVLACQTAIRDKLKGPFDVYFARYTAHDLEPLVAFGASSRPSAILDKYDFDPIEFNVRGLQDPASREFWDISFVVESAVEGFSNQKFAAVFECPVAGLKPTEPHETQRLFFD